MDVVPLYLHKHVISSRTGVPAGCPYPRIFVPGRPPRPDVRLIDPTREERKRSGAGRGGIGDLFSACIFDFLHHLFFGAQVGFRSYVAVFCRQIHGIYYYSKCILGAIGTPDLFKLVLRRPIELWGRGPRGPAMPHQGWGPSCPPRLTFLIYRSIFPLPHQHKAVQIRNQTRIDGSSQACRLTLNPLLYLTTLFLSLSLPVSVSLSLRLRRPICLLLFVSVSLYLFVSLSSSGA